MFDSFKNIDITNIESIESAFAGLETYIAVFSVIALVVFALYACRLFKFGLTVSVSAAFGYLGAWLTPIVVEELGVELPEWLALTPIVAFVLALVGAILAWNLYKAAIFVAGAASGYGAGIVAASYLGAAGAGIAFFDGLAGEIIVSVVCALICAFLFLFLYKFLYILSTSIVGMCGAAYIIGVAVLPEYALYFLAAGAVAGIIAMVYQYKTNNM